MRIRSLAKTALAYALLVCAMQANVSQTFGKTSFCSPIDSIHLNSTGIQEEPAVRSSPVSTDSLSQIGQPVTNDALYFCNLAIESSSALNAPKPAESKIFITIAAKYMTEVISCVTDKATSENPVLVQIENERENDNRSLV